MATAWLSRPAVQRMAFPRPLFLSFAYEQIPLRAGLTAAGASAVDDWRGPFRPVDGRPTWFQRNGVVWNDYVRGRQRTSRAYLSGELFAGYASAAACRLGLSDHAPRASGPSPTVGTRKGEWLRPPVTATSVQPSSNEAARTSSGRGRQQQSALRTLSGDASTGVHTAAHLFGVSAEGNGPRPNVRRVRVDLSPRTQSRVDGVPSGERSANREHTAFIRA